MHTLAADPVSIGDLGHRNTGYYLEYCAVSLLNHTQRPKHERERQASSDFVRER